MTRSDIYPMLLINGALTSFQEARYFSSVDLRSGYWQSPMHEVENKNSLFLLMVAFMSST